MSHDIENPERDNEIFEEYISIFLKSNNNKNFINEVINRFNKRLPIYKEIKNKLWKNAVRNIDDIINLQKRLE